MKLYRVGGAVRDRLLGLDPSDQDWVVVGARPEDLLDRGFTQVGRDFPVFLHPDSGEEYALARTERKTAPGYRGFEVHADPDVTLKQDLERRDLTINAIAEDEDGGLVDPFQGQQDLEARVLRHISPAFSEDPVRILRVARFASQLAAFDFTVHDSTLALMREMVDSGEVDSLVPERVWQELHKALASPAPARFIEVLRECGALKPLIPELDRLWGVPQVPRYHPEVDCGAHMMLCLEQCAGREADAQTTFAVLLHDLGKGITPANQLPRHIAHESRGVPLVKALCDRFKVPKAFAQLAKLTCRWHLHAHRALELKPATLLKLLKDCGALRQPEAFTRFVEACAIDKLGRGGGSRDYPQADYLSRAAERVRSVRLDPDAMDGISGEEIGARLTNEQRAALSRHKREWKDGETH